MNQTSLSRWWMWTWGGALLLSWVTGQIGAQQRSSADDGGSQMRLVIVTPEIWQTELADYARQRHDLDSVQVITLEEIAREAGAGRDEAERVKQFLYRDWKSHGTDYVLLVGDAQHFPVRYMMLDRVTEVAAHTAFYPSDLYYADLARADGEFDDWNQAQSGHHRDYWGEVHGEHHKEAPINFDGVSYIPEVGVGRWPIRERSQLQRVIRKSLAYRDLVKADSHPGAGRLSLLSVAGWVDSRGAWDQLAAQVPAWQVDRGYYADAGAAADTLPTADYVQRVAEAGRAVIIHAGHGAPDQWESCISAPQLAGLQTAGRWPWMLSAGCSTAVWAPQAPYEAYVDIQGQAHVGTNQGEVFSGPPSPPACRQPAALVPTSLGVNLVIDNDNGAIAYFGCATGSQPCGLTLIQGCASGLAAASDRSPRMGDVWRGAVEHYYRVESLATLQPTESWYPASVFFQGMKFLVIGDPSLPVAR